VTREEKTDPPGFLISQARLAVDSGALYAGELGGPVGALEKHAPGSD